MADGDRRGAIEERIQREARRFDLGALVRLLAEHGWPRETLLFQGNPEGGSSSLVEAVELRTRPTRRAIVTVNMGLLGDSSLLPSYFLRAIEASQAPEVFYDFVRFLDHVLVSAYLDAIWPEQDREVHGDYRAMQRAFLSLGGFASTSTLQWLASCVFPELAVRAERASFSRATEEHGFRTGTSRLDGTSVIGRRYDAEAHGFAIELTADEECNDRGRPWVHVVEQRLRERLLPIVAEARLALVVRLRVLGHASWAHLDAPGAARGWLGYDRVRGNADEPHVVVVYRGVTGDDAPGAG